AYRLNYKKMKDIAIYGAGGYGREVACIIRRINEVNAEWNFIGFIDDGVAAGDSTEYGKVLGGMDFINSYAEELALVIPIGNPSVIQKIIDAIDNDLISYPNIVDPDVFFLDSNSVKMGKGNVFSPKTLVSCNVVIGDFNLFNMNGGIGHDVTIGNCNAFMPNVNISGGVVIGDRNLFGVKSTMCQYLTMGNDNQVAAQSLIIRNAKDGFTYVGIPAIPVSKNKE
ncbi:MAG: serine acetyltransferase, partial [Bacteroides intestinalis]|nr:serine acetyltransferase [Bacteroides intestinalis]